METGDEGGARGDRIAALGAALAGLAVILGAFGAHGLRARVAPEMLAVYETGVRYQMYHALALVALGVLVRAKAAGAVTARGAGCAAGCFALGIALFSGSLYALVLSDVRALGAVTPFGGVLFIVGWVFFARAALASRA